MSHLPPSCTALTRHSLLRLSCSCIGEAPSGHFYGAFATTAGTHGKLNKTGVA